MRINKRAFTIIELIVVIAILGILILLAGPRLLGYVEKAELARIQHDVKVMENKMSDVLTTDNIFNDWQNNAKDLGRVVMRKELFEKQGVAKSIEWEHLSAKWLRVNNDKEDNHLGMGGDLIEVDDKYSTYKIIPKEYKGIINTKLKGTFYVNALGKVYYEHDKPLSKAVEKESLACVAPETSGYEFEVINGLGTITGWDGNATHLVIPAAFKMSDGNKEWCEPVRVIGKGAFQNGNFKRVTIPQSIEEIQEEAFQGGELIEIEIPHSVINIGNNAFTGNPATSSGGNGSEIIIKGSSDGRDISGSAFGGKSGTYSSVTARDVGVVTKIKTDANGSRSVSIVGNVGTSGSSKGFGLSGGSNSSSTSSTGYNNTVVNIPKEIEVDGELLPVEEIEKGAFQGSGLIDVIMPEGLLYIHDYAFAGNQLIRAIIPNSVIEVGNYAFAYNEIASKPTIDPINILESKFTGDFNNVNNEGNISQPVSTINLKDHIFIISSMGNHVIEDVGANPEQSEDNNDEDVNNKEGLMNPIEPRESIEGEITINSADKLAKIGQPGEPEYPLNGKYILTSDIDLSHIDNWVPIGNDSSRFTGSFNGNGYNIIRLTIDSPETDNVGLFGYTERAIIENVALENVNIKGKDKTGGLVGRAESSTKISNSYATGSVTGTGSRTGGLVGRANNSTEITNSYATGSVTGTGNYVGGLVGDLTGKLTASYYIGEVKGAGNNTGGIAGYINGSIIESYFEGTVQSTGNRTGGLVGYALAGAIRNSYFKGDVYGRESTGGIAGYYNQANTTNTYSIGNIQGTSLTGSLVGRIENTSYAQSVLRNSYALNSVFNTVGSSGYKAPHGSNLRIIRTGLANLSQEELKQQSSFVGWDFDTIWDIKEGESYPTLRWQNQ